MTLSTRSLVTAALLLTAARPLTAQERFGTFLDWGTVQITLSPTDHQGVRLELGTTDQLVRAAGGMAAGFEPDAVQIWLAQARAVTRPQVVPTPGASLLLTPPLVSLGGDSIRLLRAVRGRGWDRRIRVLLDGAARTGTGFDVLALPREVEELMAGLQREAGLSGWSIDSVRRAIARSNEAAELDPSEVDPPAFRGMGVDEYPGARMRGKAQFEFTVDTTGRVDPYSIQVIHSTDVRLIPWGREILRNSRFDPARHRGRPIAVLVQQTINFHR
jgi:hypothetical protein